MTSDRIQHKCFDDEVTKSKDPGDGQQQACRLADFFKKHGGNLCERAALFEFFDGRTGNQLHRLPV